MSFQKKIFSLILLSGLGVAGVVILFLPLLHWILEELGTVGYGLVTVCVLILIFFVKNQIRKIIKDLIH